MRNSWVLFVFQTKLLLKRWRFLLLFLVIPPLLFTSLFLISQQWLDKEPIINPFKIAIVDNDKTVETAIVIKQLANSEQLQRTITVIQTDENTASSLLEENQIAGILMIPKGFSNDVRRGKNTPVSVIGNHNQPLQAALVRYLIESAANLTSAAQSGINTIYDSLSTQEVTSKERKNEYKKSIFSFSVHILSRNSIYEEKQYNHLFLANQKEYYVLSFYILTLLFWGGGSVFLLTRDMFTAIEGRLQSRDVQPIQKKMAATFALLVILNGAAIIAGAGINLFFKLDVHAIEMILTSLLIMTTFMTFFMMLYSLINDLKIYQMVSVILMITSPVISGHYFPSTFLPNWMEAISAYNINTVALQYMFSIVGGSETNDGYYLFLIFIVQMLLISFFSLFHGKWWDS